MSSNEATLAPLRGTASSAVPAARVRPVHVSAAPASARRAPLRPVLPAPAARTAAPRPAATRTPTVTVVPEPVRRPITGLRDLTRRVALWGAGPQGEYLAWSTPEPAPRAPLRPRLRGLTRRIALWGAGPRGEHLAWGRPAPTPAPRQVDPPVVLRELPSTPTIRPAASSPAVALIPAPTRRAPGTGPVVAQVAPPVRVTPAGTRWAPPPPGWPQPPVLVRQPAPPAVRAPAAAPMPSRPGRTVPAARSPSTAARAGPARARGDPLVVPALQA
ncbi:hypothetical protein [Blastococcus sp. SYSU D01042]